MTTLAITQQEVEALYAECTAALDDGEFEKWPSFFAEGCSYRVTSKENVERGWPMALMSCDTRGMLVDRVMAVRESMLIIPRVQRRIHSGVRITRVEGPIAHCRASFAVFETFAGEQTTVFVTGQFVDEVVREGDALRFLKRRCILDTTLVPNSLPFPL
jgi:salicylate 5-hydroxylase small subunit